MEGNHKKNMISPARLVPVLFLLYCHCSNPQSQQSPFNPEKTLVHQSALMNDTGKVRTNAVPRDTVLQLAWLDTSVKVYIKRSHNRQPKGAILILPGWNHTPLHWCDRMRFCTMALESGYHLVMPEMQKGVYTISAFPETRKDMAKSPTMTFINQVLLPYCQQHMGLLQEGGNNLIAGISTGARGAVLVAMEHPGIFRKGVAMSGDYDNSKLETDRVMIAYYGMQRKFPYRWHSEANPILHLSKLSTPFLFTHAMDDAVVDCKHTQGFHDALLKAGMKQHQLIVDPVGGHDYPYWDIHTKRILDFFESE
jgi:pimeloyl-ACP methyl ester carboxylesterase